MTGYVSPIRRVRGEGINGEQMLDLMELPDGWLGVDFERSRGICIYSWENVITRIADLIAGGHIYRLEGQFKATFPLPFVEIDRAGNIWLDHEYLAPHQYLPKLIPEAAP